MRQARGIHGSIVLIIIIIIHPNHHHHHHGQGRWRRTASRFGRQMWISLLGRTPMYLRLDKNDGFSQKKTCWSHREVSSFQSNYPPTFPFNCCAGPAMTFENEKFPNPIFNEIDLTNIEWQGVSLNYSIRHLLGSLGKP